MMPGFVEVDYSTFYLKIWPRIKNDAYAVESNWSEGRKGVRPIIIKWGWKDSQTLEEVTIAISFSDVTGDKHWISPSLLPIR
jgi:hypothetical protein